MKKDKKKTIMILTLISIVLCGCPGCILFIPGVQKFSEALAFTQNFEDVLAGLGMGFLQGGWLICLGSILLLVPLVLAIFTLTMRRKKGELMPLEPTGASKEDPIPPPS